MWNRGTRLTNLKKTTGVDNIELRNIHYRRDTITPDIPKTVRVKSSRTNNCRIPAFVKKKHFIWLLSTGFCYSRGSINECKLPLSELRFANKRNKIMFEHIQIATKNEFCLDEMRCKISQKISSELATSKWIKKITLRSTLQYNLILSIIIHVLWEYLADQVFIPRIFISYIETG